MKQFFLSPLLLLILSASAQKIEKYYDYKWNECTPQEARFYTIITQTDSGWHRDDFFINQWSLQMSGTYEDADCKIQNGLFKYYYANRRAQYIGKYVHNKKEGQWLSYNYNGIMSDSSVYLNGNKVGISLGWYPMDI